MALDTERRAAGIRGILRRLRGAAPRPESPEDSIEGFMSSDEAENPSGLEQPQIPSEDEEVLGATSPNRKPVPPTPPRKLR